MVPCFERMRKWGVNKKKKDKSHFGVKCNAQLYLQNAHRLYFI